MTEIICIPRPDYAHKPRSVWPPRIGLMHATRGHTTLELQDDATIGWFTLPAAKGGAGPRDGGSWSPTADCLISADEDKVYVFEESVAALRYFRSSFSAGYGSIGASAEYAADEFAISVEIAQSASLEPYSDVIIARLVFLMQTLQRELGFTLPAVHVTWWDQLRGTPVPHGYIGHDETANGRKGGKSDPGSLFPWARFLSMLETQSISQTLALRTLPLDFNETAALFRGIAANVVPIINDDKATAELVVSGAPATYKGHDVDAYLVLIPRGAGRQG